MSTSDILYLIFGTLALIALCILLISIYKDDAKKEKIKEERYNYLISLLEEIERRIK